jgi:putative ABC transport system permease protein
MNIQLTLAVRYLSGRRLRTVLTTLAVVFGVLVIFAMNMVLPTMLAALQANLLATEGHVDMSVTHVTGEPFDAAVFEQARAVAGVRAASASLGRTINLPTDFYDKNPARPDQITALSLIGVVPYDARSVRAYPTMAGRYLEAGDTTAALISQTLADALAVKVGDAFPVPTAKGLVRLTVVGILPPRLGPGNEEVLVSLPQAQAMFNLPGKINTLDLNLNSMEEARRNEIVANVLAALGPDYKVGSLLGGSEMFTTVQLAQQIFDVFGLLALFMGAFIIFNTFRTIIAERRRDIGMLRAIGANRQTITGLILIEGVAQGVLGTAVGLVLGYALAAGGLKLISPLMSQFINLKVGDPVVSPSLLLVAVLLGVGVTVLAGLIPALNASRVTPLEALRPTVADTESKRQAGAMFAAGVALLVISLLALFSGQTALAGVGSLLFLVGLVMVAPALVRPIASLFGWLVAKILARSGIGDLAQGNLTRQPTRTAITASTSMLGLAVVVAAGGIVASLALPLADLMKKDLGSDYLFIPPAIGLWGSNVGAGPELTERLRAVDGVGDVSTLRFAGTTINGQPAAAMGIDPTAFPKVSGLRFQSNLFLTDAAAYQALADGRALIANGVFMLQLKAKVGDTVTLATPTGPHAYRIVAVGTDLLNTKLITVFISQANLQADFGKAEDVFLHLNLKPGANAQTADQAIRAIGQDYPQFKVVAGKAYYKLLLAELNAGFAAMYLVLALLALPSLIAMLNTLAISVIERTREIGMLRAVGTTQPQVQRMVLAEALILAAIGITFGLLAGLYLGYALVTAMGVIFPLGYAFPVAGVIAAIVIGLVFGALAAIIPAQQAARLEIVEALRYE